MTANKLIHLHVHSEYSPLDGLSKVDELVRVAKEQEMKAIAITDHGTCAGHKDLEIACNKYGIKPIFGCEFYFSETDKASGEDYNAHLIVLAKSEEGLQNLYQMYNESFDNFYRKPHINIKLLKKYKYGLIVSSACIGGTISQAILAGDNDKAIAWINEFKSIFGEDFYLEVQPNDIPEQYLINKEIFSLAKLTNTQVIATNDVHYTYKEDSIVHEIQLALQVKAKWGSAKRFKFPTNDYWFKTYDEMLETFIGSITDKKNYILAINNTNIVAEKCQHIGLPKGNFMPHFNKLEKGETEKEALMKLTLEGCKKRYAGYDRNSNMQTKLMNDISHELDVIDGEGYSGYFLIVADYIREARKAGVLVGDGRGSGAGSKVCYLTDITRVDPIQYGLVFERFMDKGRTPDIDTDVSDQDWVFRYFQSQYGERNVARIITFGTLTAKSCTRKIMGCFGFTMQEIAKVIGYMPQRLSFSIDEAIEESDQLRDFFNKTHKTEYVEGKEVKTITVEGKFMLQAIRRLEGVISHEGKHAGGMVIYPDLSKYLPLKMETDEKGNRNVPVAMLTKYPLEEAGFCKIDVLGLETLPIIKHTIDLIKNSTGEDVDIANIDVNDKKMYEMLQEGDVLGIFQLNSQASRVIEHKPRKFLDIVALTSAIRPGTCDWGEYIARRNGKEWYVAPERQRYMKQSEGLMMFQEQFLHDANTYAGWAYGYSDKHIRKNKNLANDIELKEKFIADGTNRGYDEKILNERWNEIVDVAGGGYSFNLSHAVAYSVNTAQTMYLKCYYPNYFYSALLSAKMSDQDQVANIIAECKRKKVKLLPPDLNYGTNEFLPTKDGIRIPLNYLKGVGDGVIPEIIRLRPIESLSDLFERRTKGIVRKNVLVALIKAGCFDFEDSKNNMLWKLDMLNRTKTQIKNEVILENEYPDDDKTFMKWEKEALGMNLTAHPLDNHNPRSLFDYAEGDNVYVVGEIVEVSPRAQKNGKMMAFVTLDLPCGNIKTLIFANVWDNEKIKETAQVGNIVYVKGKRSGDSILLNEMEILHD